MSSKKKLQTMRGHRRTAVATKLHVGNARHTSFTGREKGCLGSEREHRIYAAHIEHNLDHRKQRLPREKREEVSSLAQKG